VYNTSGSIIPSFFEIAMITPKFPKAQGHMLPDTVIIEPVENAAPQQM
jgi:hypothetical protein